MRHMTSTIVVGLRLLRHRPVLASTTFLSLFIGVVTTMSVLTLMNALYVKRLAVPHPHELVSFVTTTQGGTVDFFSYQEYQYLSANAHTLSSTWSWAIRPATLSSSGHTEPVRAMFVSGTYFAGLNVAIPSGRAIGPLDDSPSSSPVTLLSDTTFRRKFGGDNAIIGKVVQINNVATTIIGVMPAWFLGTEIGRGPDLVVPLSIQSHFSGNQNLLPRSQVRWLRIMGRLRTNTTLGQANSEESLLWSRLISDVEQQSTSQGLSKIGLVDGSKGSSDFRRIFAAPLLCLLFTTLFIAAIAWVNVAILHLDRGASGRHDVVVRLALGASQLQACAAPLCQFSLLVLGAGVAGYFAGIAVAHMIVGHLFSALPSSPMQVKLDGDISLMAAGVVLSAVAMMIVGSLPLLQSHGVSSNLASTLMGRKHQWVDAVTGPKLIAIQSAFTLPLVVGASLFAMTIHRLLTFDLGFQRDHVLLMHADPSSEHFSDVERAQAYDRMLSQLRGMRGVAAVGLSLYPPLTGGGGTTVGASQLNASYGRSGTHAPVEVFVNYISENFFRALRSPLQVGRDVRPQDRASSTNVVIINREAARRLLPGMDPIGRRIAIGDDSNAEVVGVVGALNYETIDEPKHAIIYLPFRQHLSDLTEAWFEVYLAEKAVETRQYSLMRETISSAAPSVSIEVMSLEDWIGQYLVSTRLVAVISSALAIIALYLSACGVYGVAMLSVQNSSKEIGVRLALGCDPTSLLSFVLRDTLVWLAIGMGVGIAITLALARTISSLLFNISLTSTPALWVSLVIFMLTCVFALLIPLRRALRVSPADLLRSL